MKKWNMITGLMALILSVNFSLAADFAIEQTASETIGLDSSENPLPGSDWVTDYTTAFANDCDDFNLPTGYYYSSKPGMRGSEFLRSDAVGVVSSYIDKTYSNCSTANSPLDPLNRATWINLGLTQKPEFGIANKNCGPGFSCLDVSIYQTTQTSRVDTLTPTPGTNATKANDFFVVAYNIGDVFVSITNGTPGIGGLQDIVQQNDQIKYCSQIKDANSEGINSEFALRPLYNLELYNWNAFNLGASKPSGEVVGSTEGKATIVIGVSNNIRYWMSKDIVWTP